MVVAGGLGVSDDIPGDEEVGAEVHFGDYGKFFFDAFLCFSVVGAVASQATFLG